MATKKPSKKAQIRDLRPKSPSNRRKSSGSDGTIWIWALVLLGVAALGALIYFQITLEGGLPSLFN